jgi:hypothetical protein
MKKLTILLLVLLLTLVVAVPAYADKPVKHSNDWEEDFFVTDCGDYVINDRVLHHERWIDFFDKDGNWIRETGYSEGVDHVYNVSDETRFAEGLYHEEWIITPGPDPNHLEFNFHGLDWNIQLPGHGTVYHESGLDDELCDWSGEPPPGDCIPLKRAGLSQRDFEALCKALKAD